MARWTSVFSSRPAREKREPQPQSLPPRTCGSPPFSYVQWIVLDTRTWRKIGTIKTKMHFWSAAIGNDGKVLYAMAPQKHSILVIDTVKMRQDRILKVGGAAALALVAP